MVVVSNPHVAWVKDRCQEALLSELQKAFKFFFTSPRRSRGQSAPGQASQVKT
jgi:hypothetical protein